MASGKMKRVRESAQCGTDLAPLRAGAPAAKAGEGALIDRVAHLIEQTRTFVATQANTNTALTPMNWHIGHMIDVEVLKENRAEHGQEIAATLSPRLSWRRH
ncbi:DUF1016 N-terminal domain-containing protein [Changpingibacter yushuensis]|uniref:DUF1016 N-terminal domain-containing protein n=1 Tax=Changpingibacter yushuensis TaxID=2758440 RepID=UPI001C70CFC9|nr:hypothetical protein [Changpingibacter yushuensis]